MASQEGPPAPQPEPRGPLQGNAGRVHRCLWTEDQDFQRRSRLDHAGPSFFATKDQRAAYDRLVQENQKTYDNRVQAAYMDSITTGKREEAEYRFAVVDNESAMSRVEASMVSAGEADRLEGLTSSTERNAQCDRLIPMMTRNTTRSF